MIDELKYGPKHIVDDQKLTHLKCVGPNRFLVQCTGSILDFTEPLNMDQRPKANPHTLSGPKSLFEQMSKTNLNFSYYQYMQPPLLLDYTQIP